ncbi:hypothetical protein [Variovorax sp. LG9.2]|uniref:hypothetical protein n=1 Tax=Variovorax sp. LG9.2 TaxID=3048626 RepID=UPI002B233ADF|nr:hypothetical protein [Variovorax sp. LG9.2]MEB0060150.1 hypothetical protein [Variovorax sp. LG9.2]
MHPKNEFKKTIAHLGIEGSALAQIRALTGDRALAKMRASSERALIRELRNVTTLKKQLARASIAKLATGQIDSVAMERMTATTKHMIEIPSEARRRQVAMVKAEQRRVAAFETMLTEAIASGADNTWILRWKRVAGVAAIFGVIAVG